MSLDRSNVALERTVAAVDQKWRERYAAAANDVALRKWCIEEARQACQAGMTVAMMQLAGSIYNFVTLGLVLPDLPDEGSSDGIHS